MATIPAPNVLSPKEQRRRANKQKRKAKLADAWAKQKAELLDAFHHQVPWPKEHRDAYTPNKLLVTWGSHGRSHVAAFGFIDSFTKSGNIRVRYLPTKRIDEPNTGHDTHWTAQIDTDAIEAATNPYELGHLETFRWKDGIFHKNTPGEKCLAFPYNAQADAQPQKCWILTD